MNRSAAIIPILILTLLTSCAASDPARSPAASGTESAPAAVQTNPGSEASASPEITGTAPTAPGSETASESEPGEAASTQDTDQVLNDIINQLDQLDRLYSELDEVSEDDLSLNE